VKRQATHWTNWVQAAIGLSLAASVAVAGWRAQVTDSDHERLIRATDELRARLAESVLLVEQAQSGHVTDLYARKQAEQLVTAIERTAKDIADNVDPQARPAHELAIAAMAALAIETKSDDLKRSLARLARAEDELAAVRKKLDADARRLP
jgi:hypothetical protein